MTNVEGMSKQRVAGVVDSGSRGQRPRLQLCRQHGRERHFTIDGLLNDSFYSGTHL